MRSLAIVLSILAFMVLFAKGFSSNSKMSMANAATPTVTSSKKTLTVTTHGPEEGTTTKYGPKTVTVRITEVPR